MAKKLARTLKARKRPWTDTWTQEKVITVETLSTKAEPEYVAWIDLMGAAGWMAGSIRKAAEMIGMIHIAGLRAERDHVVRVYPVVDGIYLVGEYKDEFLASARDVMRALALAFSFRRDEDRFLVRGGIAYGRIIHGESVAALHTTLSSQPNYARCLAIGIAIGQAYSAEKKAPPFGYYVDMTARSTARFNETPFLSAFFRWWSDADPIAKKIAHGFGAALHNHFDYLDGKYREIDYDKARLDEHRLLARQYFPQTIEVPPRQ